jgi:alpha-tubulin suppressor-like RCC1 family protein
VGEDDDPDGAPTSHGLEVWGDAAGDHFGDTLAARRRALPSPVLAAAGYASVAFADARGVPRVMGDATRDDDDALALEPPPGPGADRADDENTPPAEAEPSQQHARVRALAAGENHLVLALDDGTAWTRRDDDASARKDAEDLRRRCAPLRFPLLTGTPRIVGVAAGARHAVLIDALGRLWTFGWGLHGQLGHGDAEDAAAPRPVRALEGFPVVAAAAGTHHTLVATRDGAAYAFGSNADGQLGVGDENHGDSDGDSHSSLGEHDAETASAESESESDVLLASRTKTQKKKRKRTRERVGCSATPAPVALPRDRRGLARVARSVSCGSRHAAVVTGDGAVFAWGWGARGQLGQGGDDRASRFAPTRVRIPGGGEATDVACGWWHTCVEARAVKGDGGDGAG